jgi:hypothetical protein
MGQVYKARDGKLGREVAIKVLPASVANDPERLARFEREAKLLASLSHTNIAQIYGLEDAAARARAADSSSWNWRPGRTLGDSAARGRSDCLARRASLQRGATASGGGAREQLI